MKREFSIVLVTAAITGAAVTVITTSTLGVDKSALLGVISMLVVKAIGFTS